MKSWTDQIDPATIPDAVLLSELDHRNIDCPRGCGRKLLSEVARRNAAKRVAPSGGRNGGRPVREIECPRGCGYRCGTVAMREHVRGCGV